MTSRRANKAKSPASSPVIGSESKKSKEARTWDGKISAKDAKSLDYSNSEGSSVVNADHLVRNWTRMIDVHPLSTETNSSLLPHIGK